ncbi:unnamed protein product, partial [Polarella glacialis]
MEAVLRRDNAGPNRAAHRYLQSAAKESRSLEATLFTVDEQLAALERECSCPRPRSERLAPAPRLQHVGSELSLSTASPAEQEASAASARAKLRLRLQLQHRSHLARRGRVPGALAGESRQPGGKVSLRLLHVSPRYGKVNSRLIGIHRCRGMKRKIAEGRFVDTIGKFRQVEFRAAMQKAPEPASPAPALLRRTLVAWDRRRSPAEAVEYARADGSSDTLRFCLWATKEDIQLLFSWCSWSEQAAQRLAQRRKQEEAKGGLSGSRLPLSGAPCPTRPYPVFIPSKGRARVAHLNWRAPHVFGEFPTAAGGETKASQSPHPLVVAVVEPAEAASYREAWPQLPLLILPEGELGPSFVRWAVQRLCTAFREERPSGELGAVLRLQCCWLSDDNITCFYRLEQLPAESLQDAEDRVRQLQGSRGSDRPALLSRPLGRRRERRGEGPMFAEALLAMQRRASLSNFAVCGFLRDDGTASWKMAEWALNSTSVFKIVLLNCAELWRLQAEYLPQLRMFEDVCLNVQVRNQGGRILKSMGYCYWAVNKRSGGCESQRTERAAASHCTGLDDLIPEDAFLTLSPSAQEAVEHVYGWVHRDEARSRQRQVELGLDAPLPALSAPESFAALRDRAAEPGGGSQTSSLSHSAPIEETKAKHSMLRLSAPASVWLALLVVAGQGTHNAAALAEAGADSTCSAGRRCGKSHTPAELVSLEEERSIQSEDSSVHLLQTSVGVASRVAPLSFAEIIRDNIGLYPEFNNATDGVTTGAEIIGVAANQAGDMLAFQSAVVTHTGITVSCVCIFLVLRKRYPSMYQHNSEIYDKLKQQPLAMTDSLLDPIYVSLKVKLDDVVEVAGLDHAMLVAFSQFTIQLMLALGLPALCILSPLYYFAGGGAAGEDHLSWFGFGNVRQGNDVTWVTGIFVWYVVVVTQMLVFRWHSREYIPRRQLWLMKMPEPRCNTVLVENIPDDYQNEAKLGEFFGDIFGPGSVQKAVIVRDTSELLKAMKARDQRYQELQQAEFEYFTHGSANPGAAEQASAGWESKRQGLENTVKDAEVNVEKLRAAATASTTNVSSSAFVTFSDQKQSIMALSMRYTEDDEEFMVSVPPDPSDVIYSDLQVDWRVEDVTELTGYACIAALFFGFMPIVTGITAITNLESLGQRFPLIATFADNHEGFKSLWDGLMGSAGLTIFMSFLPTFLVMIFTKFFALRAEAWLQHRIQQWYFYFLVVFVLLVTAVGDSLWRQATNLMQRPMEIFSIL